MRSVAVAMLAATLAASAAGQTFPSLPQGTAVYDGAKLLSVDDRRSLSQLSQAFLHDTGAPLIVITLPSLASVQAETMGIEKYATTLFNRWRIGHRDANGGILLLVAKADRKVRIELGGDWGHRYDAGARDINQKIIIPAFKQGHFAQGIRDGAEALARLADRKP